MNYKTLISVKRLRISSANRHHDLQAETESDKARILFSAPFRRLQKKAQVFPLESNAAVRSRLTHTLEVATVGRQISQKIAKIKHSRVSNFPSEAFINIVESACLLHDIGNPPFGHFGEAAISNWFKERSSINAIFAENKRKFAEHYVDFENFDGNAQGLRVITKLQGEDQFGLNLTCSTISAYLKYPFNESSRHTSIYFTKKPGYFLTEEKTIKEVWQKLGIPEHIRHPLTFIMEAADDIAYCLSDIEDGIEKKVITLEALINSVDKSLTGNARTEWRKIIKKSDSLKDHINKFIQIRTTLINNSTEVANKTYIAEEKKILDGTFSESLIRASSKEYKILEAIRAFVSKNVYTSREAEIIELSGNSVITGILEKLSPLLELSELEFETVINKNAKLIKKHNLQIQSRLLNLLPVQCKKSYRSQTATNPELEWIYRAHLIVDYISGMTDDFALDIYQKLSGIRTA